MTKQRLSQLLAILLLPYTETGFLRERGDFIEELRYHFALAESKNRIRRKADLKNYNAAEKNMISFFQQHTELNPKTVDDFRLLVGHYFPEQYIVRQYRSLLDEGNYDRHAIEDFYLQNIYRIAKSLLTFRDGRIAIRTWINEHGDIFDHQNAFDKVEIWNILNRIVVPDVFIAAFFVTCGLHKPSDLDGQNGIIMMADKEMQRILEKGIAETHVHMGVCVEYEEYWGVKTNIKNWAAQLTNQDNYKKHGNKIPLEFSAAFFRMVAAEFFEVYACRKGIDENYDDTFAEFINQRFVSEPGEEYCEKVKCIWEILCALYKGEELVYKSTYCMLCEWLVERWNKAIKREDIDFLMHTVYQNYNIHVYSEILFLQKYLLYLRRSDKKDTYMRHMFFQYLRVKNNYFKTFVQPNAIEGLANFKVFYSANSAAARRYEADSKADLIFASMSNNYCLKKLELRTAPPSVKFEQGMGKDGYRDSVKRELFEMLCNFLKSYRKFILNMLEISKEEQETIEQGEEERRKWVCRRIDERQQKLRRSIPTVGLILHLIKKSDAGLRMADRCWLMEDGTWSLDSHSMLLWRKQMTLCAEAIETVRSEVPYLAEYLVGIDAASEENVAEPWIFASAFRRIRDKDVARPFLKEDVRGVRSEVNNIGLTFHVGEEFRHILSGLRHVDEVITHFKYKTGDRLGHAIVLAEDVDCWVEEHEMVVMPRQEYMDDLLWLWGKAVYEEMDLGVSLDIVQGKIMELAKEIYGEILGMTPDMLYEAYREKFRMTDEQSIFEKLRRATENSPQRDEIHFCRFYNVTSRYGITWTKDKIFCTLYCPVYYKKLYQPILVPVRRQMIPLYKKVQEQIIRRVEQIGIYVETNPTSNFIISGFKNLKESTAIVLNDKELNGGEHEVMVTVNSDDPGVFNTTSENELAYIYHSLSNMGYGKESVMAWVDKIRQSGMDSSFVKKEKTASQILVEIAEMLKRIDK